MTRPPRHAERPLLTNGILAGSRSPAAFTAVAALVVMLNRGGDFEHAAWLAYTTLVVSQCVRAVLEPQHPRADPSPASQWLPAVCLPRCSDDHRSHPVHPGRRVCIQRDSARPVGLAARDRAWPSRPRSLPSWHGCMAVGRASGSPESRLTFPHATQLAVKSALRLRWIRSLDSKRHRSSRARSSVDRASASGAWTTKRCGECRAKRTVARPVIRPMSARFAPARLIFRERCGVGSQRTSGKSGRKQSRVKDRCAWRRKRR